jgi:hypothetical protein
MPAIAATRDCERKPNEAAEESVLLSSFAAFPLPLPVIAWGSTSAVALTLSCASAWDCARACRKLVPGVLLVCAAPFLPFDAALADWVWLAALLCWLCELAEEFWAWLLEELLLLEEFLP